MRTIYANTSSGYVCMRRGSSRFFIGGNFLRFLSSILKRAFPIFLFFEFSLRGEQDREEVGNDRNFTCGISKRTPSGEKCGLLLHKGDFPAFEHVPHQATIVLEEV